MNQNRWNVKKLTNIDIARKTPQFTKIPEAKQKYTSTRKYSQECKPPPWLTMHSDVSSHPILRYHALAFTVTQFPLAINSTEHIKLNTVAVLK